MSKFGYHVVDADGHGGDLPNWFDRLPDAYKPKWQERTERIKAHFANLPGVGVMETKGTAKLDMTKRPGMTDPASLAFIDESARLAAAVPAAEPTREGISSHTSGIPRAPPRQKPRATSVCIPSGATSSACRRPRCWWRQATRVKARWRCMG